MSELDHASLEAKYQITKTYDCVETTCGELVKKLEESGGDIHCLSYQEFIVVGDVSQSDNACRVKSNWAWIQAQHPSKKLYLLTEIESKGGIVE